MAPVHLYNTVDPEVNCPICAGVRVYCPMCYEPITMHSHEGDYLCDVHSFVKPVSEVTLRALKERLSLL